MIYEKVNRLTLILLIIISAASYNSMAQSVQVDCEPTTKHGNLIEVRELISSTSDSTNKYAMKNSEVNYYFLKGTFLEGSIEKRVSDHIRHYKDSVFVLSPMDASYLNGKFCNGKEKNIRNEYRNTFEGDNYFLINTENISYAVRIKNVSAHFSVVKMAQSVQNHREFIGKGYDYDEIRNLSSIEVLALLSIKRSENINSVLKEHGLRVISIE